MSLSIILTYSYLAISVCDSSLHYIYFGLLSFQVLRYPQHPLVYVVCKFSCHWQWDNNIRSNANTFRKIFLIKTRIYGCGITYLNLAVGQYCLIPALAVILTTASSTEMMVFLFMILFK